eukprot:gnl/MRDRNA2_/MRDRNA2_111923_c0_seq1.p1 gnl/MRDRNA2_/MRDRNA2_111923_c0~~gnl/MRDRNA2_/MRDRNA2_111923_c0_seq1.p1  ORF type:complete len:237 (-),score=32.62 gnl/MRDRNA2_/MRDRNA2_111923_c0_seq1:109-819(-)
MAHDFLHKVLLVGDEAVGKTCLLLQWLQTSKHWELNSEHRVTVGVEYGSGTVEVEGKVIKLQVWDTGGQDRFRSMINRSIQGASGVFLVYDVTRRDSFDNLSTWLHDVCAHGDPDIVIIVVGTKCDRRLHRQVSYEEGHKFAQRYGFQFFESSAVEGTELLPLETGVDQIFETLAVQIYQTKHFSERPQQQMPLSSDSKGCDDLLERLRRIKGMESIVQRLARPIGGIQSCSRGGA